MNYVLDLFTPATWAAFRKNACSVTGFSRAHLSRAKNLVHPGDIFICYLVRLSRWCGALEVMEGPYLDESPIFQSDNDPWVVRFKVRPLIVLEEQYAIPIKEPEIWDSLLRTQKIERDSQSWPVRAVLQSSLVKVAEEDGQFLMGRFAAQLVEPKLYPLNNNQLRFLPVVTDSVTTSAGTRSVKVPTAEEELLESSAGDDEIRESIKKQALLVSLGHRMGFDVWVPSSDRLRVQRALSSIPFRNERASLLTSLPLNYNDATLKTIENIDVLWLRKRHIVRAFEVEHTTAIYSGLLRMADLLALQPNIEIKLHIVAPEDRREKVLEEIQRPVFSLLDKGPLAESCSYLSYEAVDALNEEKYLMHMSDSIVEEFAESAS